MNEGRSPTDRVLADCQKLIVINQDFETFERMLIQEIARLFHIDDIEGGS